MGKSKEENKLKIFCPYCNALWTATMETDFDYSMGSEWTGIYGETVTVEIYCSNCKKLIYTKKDS
jgi:hypothetical protein